MVLNCEESFHTCSSCLTLLVHAHIVPIHDRCAIPRPRYLLQGCHCFTFTPLEFYHFTFTIVIVAHLGSLRVDLGSVLASFRIAPV